MHAGGRIEYIGRRLILYSLANLVSDSTIPVPCGTIQAGINFSSGPERPSRRNPLGTVTKVDRDRVDSIHPRNSPR
jgi:hypothetical protein